MINIILNKNDHFIIFVCLLIFISIFCSCAKKVDVSVNNITGNVMLCNEPFAGAEVVLCSPEHGKVYAVTDNDGNYIFERVWEGTYSVKINKEGYAFFPEEHRVTINGADVEFRDFETIVSWSKTYDEAGKNKLFSIVQTLDCGYVFTGYKNVPKEDGKENIELWVVKLNLYGIVECEKTWGGDGIDIGYSVIGASDEGFIVTGENGGSGGQADIWVIKFHIDTDEDGNKTIIEDWERTYGDDMDDKGRAVFEEDNGDIIIAGHTVGPLQSDILILRLNNHGDLQALGMIKYGYSSWDYTSSMTKINSTEGFIISGYRDMEDAGMGLALKVFPGLTEDWYKQYRAGEKLYGGLYANPYSELYCINKTKDGGYIALGGTRAANEAMSDLWVIKLDSTGDVVWENIFDRGANEGGRFIYETLDRDSKETIYFAAGYAYSYGSGNEDFWTLKLDTSGNLLPDGESLYNGANGGSNYIEAALSTTDGGHMLAGWTESGAENDYVWIMKFDADGN